MTLCVNLSHGHTHQCVLLLVHMYCFHYLVGLHEEYTFFILLVKCNQDINGCNCKMIYGIMSATTKAFSIDWILILIWLFWQFTSFCVIYCITSSFRLDMWMCRPCFDVVFYCFHPVKRLFYDYTFMLKEAKGKNERKCEEMRETKEWQQTRTKQQREKGCEAKWIIRMEEKRKERQARKSEMWVIHKQTTPKDLGPAHLLLFTSEEIDTLWKRGSWPQDKTAAAPN